MLHSLARFLGSGLLLLLLSCQNRPEASPELVVLPLAAAPDSVLGTGQWEQAAAARGLSPAFNEFYTDSTGQFYRSYVEYSDTAPESEEQAFVGFDKCPPLDAASYHAVDSSAYTADKNGVYYFCFSGHSQYFRPVSGADPATFRALPGLEAGYDKRHVFLRTQQLPALQPAGLRVYEGPNNRPVPCGADDLYFVSGGVVVKNETLLTRTSRTRRPPVAYQRVYPVTDRE